jgi:hypothetical protein
MEAWHQELTLHHHVFVKSILLFPPVSGNELISIGLSLLHAISTSCGKMITRRE